MLSKLLAPFIPFIADEIYTNLTGEPSVHLSDWPESDTNMDEAINLHMDLARKIVELGHSLRKSENIKVRQPLGKIIYSLETKLSNDLESLILAELNIKQAEYKKGELAVVIDAKITPQLQAEGDARSIIRSIQEERKKLGTSLTEKVNVSLPDWPEEFTDEIRRKALVANLSKGDTFRVEKA